MEISIHTDGGSRGNPGNAAIGVFVEGDGKVLSGIGKRIGVETNNVAEYKAVIEAFVWLLENKEIHSISKVTFYMDSLLVFSQLTGKYKIKDENIRSMVFTIREKQSELNIPVFWNHIPREKNKDADLLVNRALDNLI